MARFSPFKSKEIQTPVEEVAAAEQKALESLEEIETQLEQAPSTPEAEKKTPAEPAVISDAPVTTPAVASAPAPVSDPMTEKIESILAEDLTDLYLKMTPSQQLVFKQKGEETATRIRQLLGQAKVNAKKIFSLLREWLKLIPGVNRFFLEQEAKIKTDKLLFLDEQERKM